MEDIMKKKFILLFGLFLCLTAYASALAAEKTVRFVIPGCE